MSTANVSSGSSKAPIIGGAVAGSLIFLGLIGAGAFFFFTKRRANAPNAPYHAPDQAIAMSNAPPSSPPPPFHDQTKNYTAGIPVGTDGKQAQVAEYQVPGMTYSELDGQSAPAAAAPMHAYGQSSPGAVDPNMNRRSELA
ncbi:hypothetical protein P154DRAFT_580229 [Amniculicola lignicola CBS 123094]|uniref:Uncharacterized protein n=1 Tax=Amniculicola lignicola CBS 123094 TaxID=1392246 RepID=A0A6A5WER3_9PLEO|nr:hypothetical protein P154DRAFT_580229 [Amniculicola lignicola CBS 123094]